MISMVYLWRVRNLVKVVVEEVENSTDEEHKNDERPYIIHCLSVFKQLKPKYNDNLLARKVLAIATTKGYLLIDDKIATDKQGGIDMAKQRLRVSGEGLVLLTPTGYLNALGGAIGNILGIISIVIAIIAIIISLS